MEEKMSTSCLHTIKARNIKVNHKGKRVPGIYRRITNHLCFKLNEYSNIAWYCPYAIYTNNSNNETDQKGRTGVGFANFFNSEKQWRIFDEQRLDNIGQIFYYKCMLQSIFDRQDQILSCTRYT